MNATFATIEEAWGPGNALASVPPNPYQNPEYQRKVLDSAASTGIVPREPQILEAGLVRAYLDKLMKDSGPMAVSALLPEGFQRPGTPVSAHPRGGSCTWDSMWTTLMDPENFFLVVMAGFALLVIADAVKKK
jgi:hypothetical protein